MDGMKSFRNAVTATEWTASITLQSDPVAGGFGPTDEEVLFFGSLKWEAPRALTPHSD
jgi:hypothetical protein